MSSLIQQMLQPEFYPHSVCMPIELIQTHISYIFLTGEYAYKLKKPVNLGFLDYSTLDQRQHFCREELRLNRRAAAPLYLDVLAITQVGDRFELAGSGTVVEYAVKMVQFPQSALLSEQLRKGLLTPSLLQSLATTVADFHRQADTSAYIRQFGALESVRQPIAENYEQTRCFIGGPQTQTQFEQTQAYTDQFFATQADLLAQRQQHAIRACHGDLHLGNICYWQDRLWLFDCIEFNESFRYVDVMYDIAYIVMDLQVAQQQGLSFLFLNHYLEQTGDWDGLKILPLYVVRQAYVRAKVTSLKLQMPDNEEADRQEAFATAARYYHYAWAYSQPQRGQLIVMMGLSGSGKSTLAHTLAPLIGSIHLRSDAVRKHLAGLSLNTRGGAELYTPEMTERTYARLIQLGSELAQRGYRVILDAKFDQYHLRQQVWAVAQTYQLPLTFLHCVAPLSVLEARLEARVGDIADATPAVLAQQSIQPLSDQEKEFAIAIDTTQTNPSQLKHMAQRLLTESCIPRNAGLDWF